MNIDVDVKPLYDKLRKRVRTVLENSLDKDERILVVVRGNNGQAIIGTNSRALVIKPGWMAGATLGSEATAYSYMNITGIQFHKGMMTGTVVVETGQPTAKTSIWKQGDKDTYKAPNAIPVATRGADGVEVVSSVAKLSRCVNQWHENFGNKRGAASSSDTGLTDELTRLAKLRSDKLLSEKEFQIAKKNYYHKQPHHAMNLTAILLNCTLKSSPQESNTEALLKKVVAQFHQLNVESEIVRVIDYKVARGVTSDEGAGDEWPQILDKILSAEILVIGTPIWFGVRGSVAQQVIERLDGTYNDTNDAGQYPLYNKVAGAVVTGNEDGAHDAAGTTLFNLSHLGCTIPPNADTYWVGPAGPGPSYLEEGQDHPYTVKTTSWMAHNLVHFARMLKATPIPPEGNTVK